MLEELQAMAPRALLEAMLEGPDRRTFNLMLIALENGMRTARRGEYEDSLVWAMERSFANAVKLESVAGLAAHLGVSGDPASAAARLLMKTELEPAGAAALGELARRGGDDVRQEARRYAQTRGLHDLRARLDE